MNNVSGIAILGAGNIGTSIADGLVSSDRFPANKIFLTRRRAHLLDEMKERGFVTGANNVEAVKNAEIVIVAVEPQQVDGVLSEIGPELDPEKQIVISVVTGISLKQLADHIGKQLPIIRAMPNTAIAVRESMTCLASNDADEQALTTAEAIFNTLGKTERIREEEMIAATALAACGVAFFLRAIRAASQGGIEIGFHSETAISIAAQTAKGAATLLLSHGDHPEQEIDRVTTPRGCTIAGLNQMEHEGFSSAMTRGITASAKKAAGLYSGDE